MTTQTLYPALRYADARAAIAWLERAFGFVAEQVYAGEGDAVAHAQLRANRDLVMLGSEAAGIERNTGPRAFGGKSTLSLNLRVADPDALFARAVAADATIVLAPYETDYGSRSFAVRDCEEYVWTVGTYAASPESDLAAGVRYDDAARAMAWLRTCGFAEHLVVPGDDGTTAHAEFALGASVLMLGSRRDDDYGLETPARVGGTTGSIYAYVADPDTLYARLSTSGATVVRPPYDTDYGSREFGVSDPEGHAFSFGTYRP